MKDTHNVAKYTYNYGIRYVDGLFESKLHVRDQGKMKDTDWNAAGYSEIEYPTFTVVDLVTGVTFLKHHRLTLKIDNQQGKGVAKNTRNAGCDVDFILDK